jgi:phospholipid/cholesterol/gamma-HCH transport system substrate-binding protein
MGARSSAFRVGVFVLLGFAALFAVVLLLGKQQSLFRHKLHLRASFANAAGLLVGSPVRLAGVDVGTVSGISFDQDLAHREVRVELSVSTAYAPRLRADSVAQLSSKGVLGDAVVDITVGSAAASPLHDHDAIRTQESMGYGEVTRDADAAIEDLRALVRTVQERINAVVTDDVAADVGRAAHSVAALTAAIEHGRGTAHELLYDRRLADDLRGAGASVQRSTTDIERVVAAVRDDIDHGRGTLGALLKDPALYDDARMLIGNASRHRVLRALIRYTVRRDGLKATPPPSSPKKQGEGAPR